MNAKRGRKAQPQALKEARSAVCFGEMYRLFPRAKNSWALERLVHLRSGSTEGIQNVKGRFSRLISHNGTPSEDDCVAVDARLEERLNSAGQADGPLDNNLRKWVYCPLWALREPNRERNWCKNALRSLEPAVRRIVFVERAGSNPTNASRRLPYETFFYLVELGVWDAFVACLLLSDEAEVIGDPVGQEIAVLCAYCCFPKAVRNESLLHSHWGKVALFLEPFWKPVLGHLQGETPIEWFQTQIYAEELDPMPHAFKRAYATMLASHHDDRIARTEAELGRLKAPAPKDKGEELLSEWDWPIAIFNVLSKRRRR